MSYPIGEPGAVDYEALPTVIDVRVTEMPPGYEPDRSKPKLYRQTFRTVVIPATSNAPVLDGPDPSRCTYYLIALDAPVALSASSGDAQANSVTNFPNPQAAAVIPQNVLIGPLDGQTQVYATTAAVASRISVISTHKVPM